MDWPVINVHSTSLNLNAYSSNIKISSYFSFWKLDNFFDIAFLKNIIDNRKILDGKIFMFLFLPANCIEFFSMISKSDIESGCILLNITHSNQRNTNQNLPSMNVLCNWESLCTKSQVEVVRSEIKPWKYCFHWNYTCHKNYVDSAFMNL